MSDVLPQGGKMRSHFADNKVAKSQKPVAGLFHAKWCGHCHQLMPEWKKFKAMNGGKLHIISYEAEKQQGGIDNIQKTYGVQVQVAGYPTIFKIDGGKVAYYEGKREAKAMSDWFMGKPAEKEPYGTGVFRGGKTAKRRSQAKKTRKNKGIFGLFTW